MADKNWPNLAAMFYEQVDAYGDSPFLWAKREGSYKPLSWGDVAARVSPLARGLLQTGIKPGDRVVLVSENRPAWLIADMAIMAIGAINNVSINRPISDDTLIFFLINPYKLKVSATVMPIQGILFN